MQKSSYSQKAFADYWNERAGDKGEAYKQYVLDPIMFELVGELRNKVIIELGCGNGYLAPKFLAQRPKRVTMLDISEHNLKNARAKCKEPNVVFLRQDATEPWAVSTESTDVVYSNMMLNEVEDIMAPINETFRVLNSGGRFVFSVTHPAWDLYVYAQEKAGKPSTKIKNVGGYFERGFSAFVMGGRQNHQQAFEVEHYHHTIADYFDRLVEAGFSVQRLVEPELTQELLLEHPRFAEYVDNPIGLVFYCAKP